MLGFHVQSRFHPLHLRCWIPKWGYWPGPPFLASLRAPVSESLFLLLGCIQREMPSGVVQDYRASRMATGRGIKLSASNLCVSTPSRQRFRCCQGSVTLVVLTISWGFPDAVRTNEGIHQTALTEVQGTDRRTTPKVEEKREQQVSRCHMRPEQRGLTRLVRGQCCYWPGPDRSNRWPGRDAVRSGYTSGDLLLFLSAQCPWQAGDLQ